MTDELTQYSENFEEYKEFLNDVVRYDFSFFDIPKEATILDVGCGFGDRIKHLRSIGYTSVFGVEPSEYSVQKAQDSSIQVGSLTKTGFEPASVDVVFVENVFHHIAEYEEALLEIARILKPQGFLCFIEPRNSLWRQLLDIATFRTPIPRIFKGPWKLRETVMAEEIETGLYPLWLKSHKKFFGLLKDSFEVTNQKNNMFFCFVKAKKR